MTVLERPRRDLCSANQEQNREDPHVRSSPCREGQRAPGASNTGPAGCREARASVRAAGCLGGARATQGRAAARQSGDFADRSREPPRCREADASAGEAGAPPAEGRSRSEDPRGLEDLALLPYLIVMGHSEDRMCSWFSSPQPSPGFAASGPIAEMKSSLKPLWPREGSSGS